MKAIVFTKYGPPDVLQLREVKKPTAKDDEVLIKIRAATVATADCEVRSFTFPPWLWLPMRIMLGVIKPRVQILGQEFAGEIEAVGKDVRRFKKGDQVFAPINGFGAHAEYICLRDGAPMATKPTNMSYEEAASVTVFALNALHFVRKANIKSGESVLINGAGGSMGTIAVQLARHFGAEVTAVDSAGKLDMLRSIGADYVIDYMQEDFTNNRETYDVVLDVVGKSPFSRSIRSLKENGRYVLANPPLLHMVRGLWTSMTSSKKVVFKFASYKSEDLLFLKELIEAGTLKSVIDKRYPLEQMAEAHAYVGQGHKKGNVVITLEDRNNTHQIG